MRRNDVGNVFSEWQPRYAERGITTFPVNISGNDKRPAIKGWRKISPGLSAHLAHGRKIEANGMGVN